MAARDVASAAELWSALKASRPGDAVLLAGNDYGAVRLNDFAFAEEGVTVRPASGMRPRLSSLSLQRSRGLSFADLDVIVSGSGPGVSTLAGGQLRFEGFSIRHGSGLHDGTGFTLRDGLDLAVVDCRLRKIGNAIGFMGCDRVEIAGNDIADLRGDGISGSSANVTVRGNSFTDFHPRMDLGDHPDAIQFWGLATGKAPGHVVEDNVITRGKGGVVQGVFVQDCMNIRVTGNAMSGTMFNGISLARVNDGLIEDNFVQGWLDMPSRIMVRSGSANVTVRGNVAQAVMEYEGPNPGYLAEGNTIIRPAEIGDTSPMTAWLNRKADPRDATIASLTAALKAEEADDAAMLSELDAARLDLGAALSAGKALRAEILALARSGRKARAKNVWLDQIISAAGV